MAQAGNEEEPAMDEEDMDTDSSLEAGFSRISFRIRVTPDLSKKQVSVLMLTPRWRFDDYGMATITRSLVQNLRMIDPDATFIKITCAVLEEDGKISRDQKEDASRHKVQLVGYSRPWGDRGEPELHWLDKYIGTYYPDITSSDNVSCDYIIGHVPYLLTGCLHLRDIYIKKKQNSKVILIVHDILRNENGEIDDEQFRILCEADVVLSLKKSVREELSRKGIPHDLQKTPPHYGIYFPAYPTELFQVNREEKARQGSPSEFLIMTKEKKHLKIKGMNLLLAVKSTAESCRKAHMTMLTEKADEREEWEKEFKECLGDSHPDVTFRCDLIRANEDLMYHFRKCELLLLPLKLSSPLFGSEALSAVAAGIPILVSRETAMGSMLLDLKANNSVVAGEVKETWTERTVQKMANLDTAQLEAKTLRETFLLDTSISSSHLDFINTVTDSACAELEIQLVTESEISDEAINNARKFGVKFDNDPSDPENYIIIVLKQVLLQREKLKSNLLSEYLNQSTPQWWEGLLASLEEENRKLLKVESGSIIFTLFCPTEESFQQLKDEKWFARVIKSLQGLLGSSGLKKVEELLQNPSDNNQISALLLTTRWMFDFTNITAVTRSLVNTLRRNSPGVVKINITCAVLELDGKIKRFQMKDAETHKVTLKGAILPHGVDTTAPEITWMNQLSAAFFPGIFEGSSFNFIIGHAPHLAYGATNLKGISKGQHIPKVVLMVHQLPKTEKGSIDKELLCKWMKGTDIVFSIGETDSNVLKRFTHGKLHQIYIPLYPLEVIRISGVNSALTPQKITVMVGNKKSGYNGLNMKLFVAAVGQAVQTMHQDSKMETHITFIGEESAHESDLKMSFNKALEPQNMPQNLLKFDFLSLLDSRDSGKILSCMIKSSLFALPLKKNYSVFGLEALTAAFAGIPILVSENSGVAALIQEVGEGEHSVVRQRKHFDEDVQAWAEKILERISNQDKAQEEANRLREYLLKSTRVSTTHSNFITAITRSKEDRASISNMERIEGIPGKDLRKRNSAEPEEARTKKGMKKRGISIGDPIVRWKYQTHNRKRPLLLQYIRGQNKELTEERLYILSKDIANKKELRTICLQGLKMSGNVIDSHITDNRDDITSAAYGIFKDWLNSQENGLVAYKNLCDALEKVKMPFKIQQLK